MTQGAENQKTAQRTSYGSKTDAIESLVSLQQSYSQESHLTLQRWSVLLVAPLIIVRYAVQSLKPSATWRDTAFFIAVTLMAATWVCARRQTKKGHIERSASLFAASIIVTVSFALFLYRGTAATSLISMATAIAYSALVSTRLLYFSVALSVVGFVVPELLYTFGAYSLPHRASVDRATTSVMFVILLMPLIISFLLSRRRANRHLVETLEIMNHEQNALIAATLEVSSDVETTIDRISKITDAFRSHAADQAGAIAHINASVAALSRRADQTSDAAKQAADIVKKIKHESAQGLTRLSVVERGFKLIVETNKTVQTEFDELAAQAENIEGILNLNKEIAGQIKILAVNAGIQAAKAGSYGSGFRVVANELKAMIIRTDDSLSAGRELLEQIRNRARHSAYSIQASSEMLEAQFKDLSSASASLEGITESFSEISDRIAVIIEEVGRQQTSLEDVRSGADYLDFSAKDLDDSSKALSASLERIKFSTASLRQSLD